MLRRLPPALVRALLVVGVAVLFAIVPASARAVNSSEFTDAPITAIDATLLYNGGTLYAWNGGSVASWDGTEWSSWGSAVPGGGVYTMRNAAPVVADDQQVYAFGGDYFRSDLWTTAANVYDTGTGAWTPVSSGHLQYARSHAVAVNVGGVFYVFGGGAATVETYDPQTQVWGTAGTAPCAITSGAHQTDAVYQNGVVYFPAAQCSFTIATQTWDQNLPAPPTNGYASPGVYVGGPRGLVYGFWDPQQTPYVDEQGDLQVVSYDPSTRTWTTGTDGSATMMPHGAAWYGDAFLIAGKWPIGGPIAYAFTDAVPPQGTFEINAGAVTTTSPTVAITSTATDTSGVAVTRIASSSTETNGRLTYGHDYPYGSTVSWDVTIAPAKSGDGGKTVWVQWKDPEGNWSVPTSRTILLDRTAPAFNKKPSPAFIPNTFAAGIDALPIVIKWHATDSRTGVADYDLESTVNGAASPIALATPSSTSWTTTLARGFYYPYRARAQDGAGNRSVWVAGPSFTVAMAQESSSSVHYTGTWKSSKSTAWLSGTDKHSSAPGATASFTFTGRAVGIIASHSLTSGAAKIYVDGNSAGSISLYSTTPDSRVIVFARSWPSRGTHTIKIVCTGTAGHSRIDLDAFPYIR